MLRRIIGKDFTRREMKVRENTSKVRIEIKGETESDDESVIDLQSSDFLRIPCVGEELIVGGKDYKVVGVAHECLSQYGPSVHLTVNPSP
jgi:hypothetical protein